MDKKDPIKVIELYKKELETITEDKFASWKAKCLDTIKIYLGEEKEGNLVQSFSLFRVDYSDYVAFDETGTSGTRDQREPRSRKKGEEILSAIIEHIKVHGVIKILSNTKSNIFSELPNWHLFSIIGGLLLIVFSIGYYFGLEKVNRESIECSGKYNLLRDSLRVIPSLKVADEIPHEARNQNQPDTTKKYTIKH